MAAYASLVSLARTIQHFLHHQFPSTSLVGKLDIESLQEHVNLLQAFFDDFPDKVTADLEGRVRDASNVAEDLIECLMLEHFQSAGSQDFPFVLHQKGLWKKLKVRYNLQILSNELQEIGSIGAEVKDIKNMTTAMKLNVSSSSAAAGGVSSSGLPPNTGKDDIMVGFDDDLLAIKTRLCGGSSRLRIIPICGMGGIGKTTLAKKAYEDPLTVEYFHIRAWVTVSQDYKAQEVVSCLRDSIKAFTENQHDQRNEAMEVVVYKSLKGRRYLIVLDDMWSTKVWDDAKRFFPGDKNGSRIILTTRLSDVAAYADSHSPLHQMRFIDVDRSWDLLRQKVFKKEHCPPPLENIGRTIAGSCKGLPLAIVVVAGILSTISQTKASWERVAEKVISTVTTDEQFARIFSLSYTHLPHHLRLCFLYMGRFPEDYEIYVSKLVKLWMGEGFLKLAGSESLEDVAEEYLEDLVERSLVLVTRRKSNGKIKSCGIHDLVRDLCIIKAREEKFLTHDDPSNLDENLKQRRLSRPQDMFLVKYLCSSPINLIEWHGPTVHSVLFFHGLLQLISLKRFRLLRVLDVVECQLEKFPDEVLELYLLRYLAFITKTFNTDLEVPSSISKLQNLQTLLIFPRERHYSRRTRVLFPLEIWSMPRLRHLHVAGILVPLPKLYTTSFALQDLQTLATAKNFMFTKRVLQMIPNLTKLGIIYDDDAGYGINWEEYHLDNLAHLRHLQKLSISARESTLRCVPMWGEPQFPMMLKKLKLNNLRLSKHGVGIIGPLPNLEVLKLIRCGFEDATWETTKGEFPKLKVLKMSLTFLKKWTTESSHFPSLKYLHLSDCLGLIEIPEGIGEIPTLELIEVSKRPESVVESAERIKEEQQSYGNDSLEVRIDDWFTLTSLD